MLPYSKTNVKSWSVEDQPIEKMKLKGTNALSNAELLAILIGNGTKDESSVDIARNLLALAENNLSTLGELKNKEYASVTGIGEAKAAIIEAAIELGKRRQAASALERPQIRCSQDAYHVLAPVLMDLAHEEFWVLVLNRANKVIGKIQISSGGLSGTVVDTKILFKRVLDLERVNAIVIFHNHPSGNLTPSQADVELTKKVVEGGRLLDVKVLDHIIVAGPNYYSFMDEGLL